VNAAEWVQGTAAGRAAQTGDHSNLECELPYLQELGL
jgi:hypothetical protein